MSKPLVIKLREAKESITGSINTAIKSGIPCFLLESIIADLHRQVSQGAQIEYEQARKQVMEEAKKQHAKQEKAGDAPERKD